MLRSNASPETGEQDVNQRTSPEKKPITSTASPTTPLTRVVALQRLIGNRAVAAMFGASSAPTMPTVQRDDASDLIDKFTTVGFLDENALGRKLFDLAWMSPDHYSFVTRVIGTLDSTDRDDVSSAFVRTARDEHLDEFARTDQGRQMLTRMKQELLGGFTWVHEGFEAVRLKNALDRFKGAQEGEARAKRQMDAAEAAARGTPVAVPTLTTDQLNDRIRLVELVLNRMTDRHKTDQDIVQAINGVRQQLDTQKPLVTSNAAAVAARLVVAQRIVERAERNLELLTAQITQYSQSSLGATQYGYIESTQQVRARYVTALGAAMSETAGRDFQVAEAAANTLPRALTEIELGVLKERHAGYAQYETRANEMVEWVTWVRDRLAQLDTDAAALADARRTQAPNLQSRQDRFVRNASILQLSMEGLQHWERGLDAGETLTGGVNLIPGAYGDVAAILLRCLNMRTAAYAGNLESLRALLERHRTDPNVIQFYRSIPVFIGASQMLAGLGVMLVSAAVTAGVGSLVAVGEEASLGAAAGSVALEAITFTATSHALSGAIGPPQNTPLLVELAMNAGLFGILRMASPAVRGAMVARGLEGLAGTAQHAASYAILQGWGALQFRVEEGRWPTGDELARISAESVVMLAGIAVASRSVSRLAASQQRMRAIEVLQNKHGAQLTELVSARLRLTAQMRSEIVSGRGDDPATVERLRKEAEKLDAQLSALVESVRKDPAIGIEALRNAMGDLAQRQGEIGGDLLTQTLELPERVALRHAGGERQYTYEAGTSRLLTDRLRALGAQLAEGADGGGRRTVTATLPDQPPTYFVERSTPADLQPKLKALADLILKAGASNQERGQVIGQLRTPHGQGQGALEGFALDAVLTENQRAVADLIAQLRTQNPDVIVGLKRGGAFWVELIGAGAPDLAGKVRQLEVHLSQRAKGDKFDGPAMQAEFESLISGGANKIALVDVYMGGRTASSLRDQVFKPLARKHSGVSFDVHWVRETLGFEKPGGSGGTVMNPMTGASPAGGAIHTTERQVRLALGDDMNIAFDPTSREPITIFDAEGKIVRVFYPQPGQTTRQLLIQLLTQPPAGP
jgi:hypothetical protein